ncbi:DMT family transporter [Crenobacter cavernae]|uniref:DMT family transporter n=1 Tax=Crenobacter cavernae TaxID=2290923 RepID=A0A345Y947_9NEIS|nr:DMT family transporter [Crenobacter cavernae]AXK40449.1 DMT family transporter [Crenobacter cavernae]
MSDSCTAAAPVGRFAFVSDKGFVYAVLAAVGFSAKAIFVKIGYRYGATAEPMLALRMVFALPFFAFMAYAARGTPWPGARPTLKQWGGLVWLGLMGYYLSSLFDFLGLEYVSAALERLTLFLYPTLVLMLSHLFLGKRYPRAVWGAVALAYAGIGLAFWNDLVATQMSGDLWIGVAWVVASTLSYAIYLIGSGEAMGRFGAPRLTAYTMLVAVAAVLIHAAAGTVPADYHLPWQAYASALAMALFSTVLPVRWLNLAIRQIGAGRAASVGTLGPVLTMAMAWALLGESLSALQIAGAMLVIAGVVLIGRARR